MGADQFQINRMKRSAISLPYGLQIADQPAVRAGSHEDKIVQCNLVAVNDFIAIESLDFKSGSVAQLHRVAPGSVEQTLQFVPVIHIADVNPCLVLIAYQL